VLAFIRPSRPMPAKKPPVGGAWLHEPKLDGYRLQVIKDGKEVRLYSRNGQEWTKRLAVLTNAMELFAFAGIYRQWKGPIKKDGPNVDIEVYSVMTTLPNALTTTINHERSPVLLREEAEFATWLDGTPEEAFGLIRTSDSDRMQIVQSGFDKKDLMQAA
jgi:putative SOS response-associated peptidase YedK